MKLCVDCKHYVYSKQDKKDPWEWPLTMAARTFTDRLARIGHITHQCHRERKYDVDLVTGNKIRDNILDARKERCNNESGCGEEGYFWEPK